LIDKLDTAIHRQAEYTKNFVKVVELSYTPEWRGKVWTNGGHYQRRGDFREISGGELPVILHQHNMHDYKADDKIELIETGILTLAEMNETVRSIYKVEPLENRVMRLDLAADTQAVSVDWFRTNTYVHRKQEARAWMECDLSARRAQTLMSGKKPNQLRIYDKTGHRKVLLARELRRMTKEERPFAMAFEERWGYDPGTMITRVERQIGGAGVGRFGFTRVGNLYKLSFTDPFEQICFAEDVPAERRERRLTLKDKIIIDHLKEMASSKGLQHTRDYMFAASKNRCQFYRAWDKYKGFVMELGDENMTREKLHEAFLSSVEAQLKPAA
jgi:hypothetical protein